MRQPPTRQVHRVGWVGWGACLRAYVPAMTLLGPGGGYGQLADGLPAWLLGYLYTAHLSTSHLSFFFPAPPPACLPAEKLTGVQVVPVFLSVDPQRDGVEQVCLRIAGG